MQDVDFKKTATALSAYNSISSIEIYEKQNRRLQFEVGVILNFNMTAKQDLRRPMFF